MDAPPQPLHQQLDRVQSATATRYSQQRGAETVPHGRTTAATTPATRPVSSEAQRQYLMDAPPQPLHQQLDQVQSATATRYSQQRGAETVPHGRTTAATTPATRPGTVSNSN
ncbi:hypothetical protein JYU34_020443 [Plutella xylostella]|uniref:Uncharacterized protein n=1 Tax=Plutella xylostella TaxID=51655 RepID=A0ABQ7PUJ3_PLUXY|nr:hypothetical protein JYU34_020443 [Plutella xylostella]